MEIPESSILLVKVVRGKGMHLQYGFYYWQYDTSVEHAEHNVITSSTLVSMKLSFGHMCVTT